MDVTKPYDFIWFGDIHGHKPKKQHGSSEDDFARAGSGPHSKARRPDRARELADCVPKSKSFRPLFIILACQPDCQGFRFSIVGIRSGLMVAVKLVWAASKPFATGLWSVHTAWLFLRRFLILLLAPLPRGLPGEGPD